MFYLVSGINFLHLFVNLILIPVPLFPIAKCKDIIENVKI